MAPCQVSQRKQSKLPEYRDYIMFGRKNRYIRHAVFLGER